jgi:hypothetical protein
MPLTSLHLTCPSTTHFGFCDFHLGINISCKQTYEIDNLIMNC